MAKSWQWDGPRETCDVPDDERTLTSEVDGILQDLGDEAMAVLSGLQTDAVPLATLRERKAALVASVDRLFRALAMGARVRP